MAETISRYEIVRELGRGGMAIVYLARDPLMDRLVAVKVLPRQFTFDPGFRSRFQREAQIVAQLEHPAIVPVYDFGEFDDQPFLVMRYMAGGSLRGRLINKPLPLAEVAWLYGRLAAGLDKAHRQNIIHRDIKPDNVLFDDEGLPYLADFGIARLAEASQTMTVAGTPTYMSPEQVHGKQTLDGRADIYALGVMLFELLTGRPPYGGDTNAQLMFKHAYEPLPDVLATNPALPAGAREVIVRSMAKAPADRYRTAAELAAAVQRLAGQTPAGPIIPTPPPATVPVTAAALPPMPSTGGGPRQPEPFSWWLVARAVGGVLLVVALIFLALRGRVGVNEVAATPAAAPFAVAPSHTPAPSRPSRTPTLSPSKTVAPSHTPAPSRTPTRTPTATPTPDPALPPPFAGLGDTWERPGDGMVMVYVPAGSFLMGSAGGDTGAYSDEFPQHRVTLDAFWLDQTEVTNGRYDRCMADGGCSANNDYGSDFNGESQPVVGVSWEDAADYCAWAGGQLATEAQWEYAARGPESLKYPWGNSFDGVLLNFCDTNCTNDWRDAAHDDGYRQTAPVGSYPAGASWVGALDMAGNVYEWVADWYDADYYDSSPAANPAGPAVGETKVLRGGHWYGLARYVRGAYRYYGSISDRYYYIGIRCLVPQS